MGVGIGGIGGLSPPGFKILFLPINALVEKCFSTVGLPEKTSLATHWIFHYASPGKKSFRRPWSGNVALSQFYASIVTEFRVDDKTHSEESGQMRTYSFQRFQKMREILNSCLFFHMLVSLGWQESNVRFIFRLFQILSSASHFSVWLAAVTCEMSYACIRYFVFANVPKCTTSLHVSLTCAQFCETYSGVTAASQNYVT